MNSSTVIILILLALSFYFHYTTKININTLFEKSEEVKKHFQN